MKVGEIDVGERFSKKIAMDSTAELLFKDLEPFDKAILDFKNVEFLSRSFAQEYVYQRYHSKVEIEEVNMSNLIKGLFEVVEEDFRQSCL